jgi:hypothetical protein
MVGRSGSNAYIPLWKDLCWDDCLECVASDFKSGYTGAYKNNIESISSFLASVAKPGLG